MLYFYFLLRNDCFICVHYRVSYITINEFRGYSKEIEKKNITFTVVTTRFGHLIFYQIFANPSNGKKNCALKRALTLFHTQYLKDFGKEDNSEQILLLNSPNV